MNAEKTPCCDCRTKRKPRSACPLCGLVFCQRCAEKPSYRGFSSCCEYMAFVARDAS